MNAAALSVEGVSHSYGSRKALDDVSLTIPRGRFTVLLGPNGAGKTTLFSLVTRLFATRAGRIAVFGHALERQPGEALRRMGVVFQARTLDLDLSLRDNLRYHAALHGIGRRAAERRARALVAGIGLAERAGEPARKLSGGQMRRLEIVRALLHEPQLLLLDEPTVGLDVASKSTILREVRGLVRDRGLAVLWATHLLDEIEPDDEVVVLHKGRVVGRGSAEMLSREHGGSDLRAAFRALTEDA